MNYTAFQKKFEIQKAGISGCRKNADLFWVINEFGYHLNLLDSINCF